MVRSPKNIVRHELIGLPCEVVRARNPAHVGVQGRVVDETLRTLVVAGKRVPKAGSVFRFLIDGVKTDVSGAIIAARPEDRIKKKISRW